MVKAAILPAIAVYLIAAATPASAQPRQTFVSGTGNDANPCSRTRPCRTLDRAITVVADGGQVIVLDSATYGNSITIGKALSIYAPPGVYAGIVQDGSVTGVTVAAPAGAAVVLSGLTIRRFSPTFGGRAIRFNSGGELHVERSVIEGAFGDGIVAGAASARFYLVDTLVRGGIDENAIDIAAATAFFDRVRVETTALEGLEVANARVSIRDSSFAGARNAGIAISTGGEVNVENSLFSLHGVALNVMSGGTVRVSNSTFFGNSIAVGGSGTRISFGNNRFAGNGSDGTFTSTSPLR